MTQIKSGPLTLEVKKVISAPVERVFKAWTDAEQMQKWLGGDMCAAVRIDQDVRVGGHFRFHASKTDGQTGLTEGIFKEIIQNKKLVFTWTNNNKEAPAKDTLVTVEFIAHGDKTEVVIKHTNFEFEQAIERHNMGWTGSLEKLERLMS